MQAYNGIFSLTYPSPENKREHKGQNAGIAERIYRQQCTRNAGRCLAP